MSKTLPTGAEVLTEYPFLSAVFKILHDETSRKEFDDHWVNDILKELGDELSPEKLSEILIPLQTQSQIDQALDQTIALIKPLADSGDEIETLFDTLNEHRTRIKETICPAEKKEVLPQTEQRIEFYLENGFRILKQADEIVIFTSNNTPLPTTKLTALKVYKLLERIFQEHRAFARQELPFQYNVKKPTIICQNLFEVLEQDDALYFKLATNATRSVSEVSLEPEKRLQVLDTWNCISWNGKIYTKPNLFKIIQALPINSEKIPLSELGAITGIKDIRMAFWQVRKEFPQLFAPHGPIDIDSSKKEECLFLPDDLISTEYIVGCPKTTSTTPSSDTTAAKITERDIGVTTKIGKFSLSHTSPLMAALLHMPTNQAVSLHDIFEIAKAHKPNIQGAHIVKLEIIDKMREFLPEIEILLNRIRTNDLIDNHRWELSREDKSYVLRQVIKDH